MQVTGSNQVTLAGKRFRRVSFLSYHVICGGVKMLSSIAHLVASSQFLSKGQQLRKRKAEKNTL